jgi:hypothetical protein
MRHPPQSSRQDRTPAAKVRSVRQFLGILLAAVLPLLPFAAPAQPSTAREYEVKAGFLVKFTQYTAWPSNTFNTTNAPLVIGVLGGESLFNQLEQEAAGLSVARPVKVRWLHSVDEAARCHVVFISESENRNEAAWFDALKGKPILTVGESDKTIEHGAVMRFVIKNKSVRFEANLASAAENRLELNDGMLRVAVKVYKQSPAN